MFAVKDEHGATERGIKHIFAWQPWTATNCDKQSLATDYISLVSGPAAAAERLYTLPLPVMTLGSRHPLYVPHITISEVVMCLSRNTGYLSWLRRSQSLDNLKSYVVFTNMYTR